MVAQSGICAVELLPFVLEDALEEASGDADVERMAAIPGPQMRGTGGTRAVVGEQVRVGRPALQPVWRPALQKTLALGHELAQGFGVVCGQRFALQLIVADHVHRLAFGEQRIFAALVPLA